jgi:hypothetical protein
MSLYDQDFYLWTQEQAAILRRLASERSNLPLDWGNLVEEIESLGRSEWRALQSELERIVEHLLKLHFSPAHDPRRGWRETVVRHRHMADMIMRDNPSFRRRIGTDVIYKHTRRLAADSLADRDGGDAAALPPSCPYSLDQILDDDWLPPTPA